MSIYLRLRSLFRKDKVEQELNDEIQFHIERQTEHYIAQGLDPREARRAAALAFGGIEQHKESSRDTRGVGVIEDLAKDVQYALRQLYRAPGLTCAAVLSLALGIGANTAIFTAIDAVMLRLLPVKDPKSLVMLNWSAADYPRHFVHDMLGAGRPANSIDHQALEQMHAFSYRTFEEIRDRNHVFSATFAAAGNGQEVNAQINGVAQSAAMQGVSGNYFEALGVSAVLGRALVPDDDRDAAPAVAVISDRFWKGKLSQDPSVVGRSLIVNGKPMTVVGVAPPEFFGLAPGSQPDLWIPLSVYMAQEAYAPGSRSQVGDGPPTPFPYWRKPTTWWLEIFGRTRPESQQAQAATEIQGLFVQSLEPAPTTTTANELPRLHLASIEHGLDDLREQYSTSLFLLMAVSGVVLMVACGNVAALLFARATARRREIAVRLSLGAGGNRLVQQLLTESFVLAFMGGGLGLFIAMWMDSALVALLAGGRTPLSVELHPNVNVLLFTAAISILTGVLFGLAPALHATRTDLAGAIKQGDTRAASTDNRFRNGKIIVVAQVALCFALLASAGLFLRTIQNLHAIETGFDPQQLLLFTVRPGLNGYKDERLADYYEHLRDRIASLPGVRSVSLSTRGPIGQGVGNSGISIPGYTTPGQLVGINRHQVSAGYFETLGIPVTRGRGIEAQDRQTSPKVVVVNERLAREYFHGDDPIGHRIYLGVEPQQVEFEIVGVAKDVKYNRMQDDAPPTIYYPYLQFFTVPAAMVFEVRQSRDVSALIGAIRHETSLIDSNVPITDTTTEAQLIERTFSLERLFAALTLAFALVALVLVTVGLYGTMAYTVTRQSREIGIRMALGARRETIRASVLGQALSVLLSGLPVGMVMIFAATPLLKSRLFGLASYDAAAITAAVATITIVTMMAGYLPARRASRIDPMIALRDE
jgi:predicted permease